MVRDEVVAEVELISVVRKELEHFGEQFTDFRLRPKLQVTNRDHKGKVSLPRLLRFSYSPDSASFGVLSPT